MKALQRHLHWLLEAPSLLITSSVTPIFEPAQYQRARECVDDLDLLQKTLGERGELLSSAPHRRLGQYFEDLYGALLVDILGYILLARNLPIRDGAAHTLGELDFLVINPHSGAVEHHEIAVKFYLGVHRAPGDDLWFGPDSRDRLDLKNRKLAQQMVLTEHPVTQRELHARGLPPPERVLSFMPGYLFRPQDNNAQAPHPIDLSQHKHSWHYADTLLDTDMDSTVVLHKPHWLSPWRQDSAPVTPAAVQAKNTIATGGHPRLFARLLYDNEQNDWQESQRFFLVPPHWPAHHE
jgi:hypothetical protein